MTIFLQIPFEQHTRIFDRLRSIRVAHMYWVISTNHLSAIFKPVNVSGNVWIYVLSQIFRTKREPMKEITPLLLLLKDLMAVTSLCAANFF
jgi:hypothetical protein